MRIIAIDPGTTESAFVLVDDDFIILDHGKIPNERMIESLRLLDYDHCVIEMIASYGMAVGKEVFETCVWIGRFMERSSTNSSRILRRDVKLNMCGSVRAKDGNIRQALIDRFGSPGTKKAPGHTHGLSADQWQAFALAVTCIDSRRKENTLW